LGPEDQAAIRVSDLDEFPTASADTWIQSFRLDEYLGAHRGEIGESGEVGKVEGNDSLDPARVHHRDEASIVDVGSH
jgi:hypothetical protein